MKKLVVLAALVLVLSVLTLGSAFAMDMEDPVLCVAGQWLTVEAADPSGVTVVLPDGVAWGESGGCGTSTSPVIDNVIVTHGGSPLLQVKVKGDLASTPDVVAAYAGTTLTRSNNGHQTLVFQFSLR